MKDTKNITICGAGESLSSRPHHIGERSEGGATVVGREAGRRPHRAESRQRLYKFDHGDIVCANREIDRETGEKQKQRKKRKRHEEETR